MDKPIDTFKLYKDMVINLNKTGGSAEGMWPAYLQGELRIARARIKELEQQTGDI
jgi:hypothetical protein